MASDNINDNRSWASAIAKGTFLLLTGVLFVAVVYILRSVLHAIILGVLFALLLMPLNDYTLKHVCAMFHVESQSLVTDSVTEGKTTNKREARCKSIAAMLSVTLVIVVILVPLVMFGISVVRQGYNVTVSSQRWIVRELPGKIQEAIEKYHLQERLDKLTQLYGNFNSMMSENEVPEQEKNTSGKQTDADEKVVNAPNPLDKVADSVEIKTETVKTHTVGESVGHRAAHGDGAEIHPYSGHVNFSRDVGPYAAKVAGAVMEFLRDTLVKLLSKLGVLLFNFCVMLFVMYQFFYDGRHMLAYIKSISPLSDDAMKRVETRVREVSRAVVYGIFGTAVTQGICAMLFFKLAGIPVFWGVVLGICSIIPVVGTSLIWVPVVVYLFLIGAYGKAVFIFITCGCIVANFDMILRPLLMKRSGETGMSYMVLFLSILGGIQTFGLVGIIYGPMITGICSICLLIFSTQFKAKRELEENKETEGELQG